VPLFTSGGLGLGLVSSGLDLGLKSLVLFTSLLSGDCLEDELAGYQNCCVLYPVAQ